MISQENFLSDLEECLTPFHYVQYARKKLQASGYVGLDEKMEWNDIPAKFFVVRSNRTIFVINKKDLGSGTIFMAHNDDPAIKCAKKTYLVKDHCEQIRIVGYGNGNWISWLDRDLRIAGAVNYYQNGEIKHKIVQSPSTFASIPSIASHLSTGVGKSPNYKFPENFHPIVRITLDQPDEKLKHSPYLLEFLAKECECNTEDIFDLDLYFVAAENPAAYGLDRSMISSQRLDGMGTTIISLDSFLNSPDPNQGLKGLIVYDMSIAPLKEVPDISASFDSAFLDQILRKVGISDDFYGKSHVISIYNDGGAINSDLMFSSYSYRHDGMDNDTYRDFQELLNKENLSFTPRRQVDTLRKLNSLIISHNVKISEIGISITGLHSICEVVKYETLEKIWKAIAVILNKDQ